MHSRFLHKDARVIAVFAKLEFDSHSMNRPVITCEREFGRC